MSNDPTPEFMNPSAAIEAHDISTTGKTAVEKLRAAARAGTVDRETPNGIRTFISPTHTNGKFLARPGVVVEAPFQTASLGMRPAIERTGDVFVKFSSGVISTEDPVIIEWLEAHAGEPVTHREYHTKHGEDPRLCSTPMGLCHEQGPGVDVWAELKAGQLPTSRRGVIISPEIDVDAFLRGDHLAEQKLQTGEGARLNATIEANENAAKDRADGKRGS